VVSIEVGNAVGNLRSVDTTANREQLGTNLLVDGLVGLLVEERVPQVVAATDDLNIVHIVTVDGWEADTAVVHLSGENFVTKEVVTEDSGIRVSEIVRVSHSDIWEVTEESVHSVVLLGNGVQVLSMLVNSVLSENVLEEQESVVVLVLNGWSIIEDSNVGVIHLIISDEEHGWNVDGLVHVGTGTSGFSGDRLEAV
jgi:hypothetical protein